MLHRCSAVFHATCGTQKQPCDNATRFAFLYMLALDCKQSCGIGARRYFMPPTALKNNLATTLRVLFFYICSLLTASSRAALVLGGISCHRRHSKITLRQRYAFCFFYICSYVFASESTAYIKKQPYGFRKVVFSFGAGGRTRTDTDD